MIYVMSMGFLETGIPLPGSTPVLHYYSTSTLYAWCSMMKNVYCSTPVQHSEYESTVARRTGRSLLPSATIIAATSHQQRRAQGEKKNVTRQGPAVVHCVDVAKSPTTIL